MGGAIHPLPQYTFMTWCLVKKHRDKFTFLFLQGQIYLYLYFHFTGVNDIKVKIYFCRCLRSLIYLEHFGEPFGLTLSLE
jgi:hypothetical protein